MVSECEIRLADGRRDEQVWWRWATLRGFMGASAGASTVDPFFETIADGDWNACVGSQGREENYIDGYIEAAIELASAVIDKHLYSSRDTLAMPILYNGRHALELSLKFAINRLFRMGVLGNAHRPDHDILSHWKHLRDAGVGDTTTRALIDELEPFVVSLANIDDDGQELRYPKTQTGKKNLDNIAVVNLPHIRASLQAMGKTLKKLIYRIEEIEDERRSGIHTRECSRRDLREIAGMLGNYANWTHESFNERKAAVCARFGLRSRKFSQAVTKIKESRELGALVGLEQPLHHLSDEKAVAVLDLWAKANPEKRPNPNDLSTGFWKLNHAEMLEHLRTGGELIRAVRALLTPDGLADLETLFYVGRGSEQCEHYEQVLQYMKNAHLISGTEVDFNHILSKTSLLKNVIIGARLLGRPSLASRLQAIRPVADRIGAASDAADF